MSQQHSSSHLPIGLVKESKCGEGCLQYSSRIMDTLMQHHLISPCGTILMIKFNSTRASSLQENWCNQDMQHVKCTHSMNLIWKCIHIKYIIKSKSRYCAHYNSTIPLFVFSHGILLEEDPPRKKFRRNFCMISYVHITQRDSWGFGEGQIPKF